MNTKPPRPLHPQVGIGHVHQKVADLDRALRFTGMCFAMFTKPLDLDALLKA